MSDLGAQVESVDVPAAGWRNTALKVHSEVVRQEVTGSQCGLAIQSTLTDLQAPRWVRHTLQQLEEKSRDKTGGELTNTGKDTGQTYNVRYSSKY